MSDPTPTDHAALLAAVDSLSERVRASEDPSVDREGALELLDDLRALLVPQSARASRVGRADLTAASQPRRRPGRGRRAGF